MAKNLQYTDRDMAALTEIGNLGLMSTDMIHQRHFAAGESGLKYCQRRLREFADNKLTERISITVQEMTGNKAGRPRKLPDTHRLTEYGADEVEKQTAERPIRWATSDAPKPATILHRLGVVRTRLAINDACKELSLPTVQWHMEQDTQPGAKISDHADKRFVLYEAFGHGEQRVTCRPDAAAWLQLPGEPTWNLALYLEYDRSTESEKQIVAKLPGYATLFHPSKRSYRRHWPELEQLERDFARVLFVCPSHDRLQNLRRWITTWPGAEYVRFAVEADMTPQKVLTEPIWHTINGQRKAIVSALPSS